MVRHQSIGLTQEQYAKLEKIKGLYEKDMGVRLTWGQFLLTLAAAYFIGKQIIEDKDYKLEVMEI